ncbi:MAG: hypothetical protein IIC58_12590 [Proteobacteria bacterium]|nr:hypothetical protein [Pseudomonadota bacterium]
MDVEGFLDQLVNSRDYRQQISHCHTINARPARFATPNVPIDSRLKDALAHEGRPTAALGSRTD